MHLKRFAQIVVLCQSFITGCIAQKTHVQQAFSSASGTCIMPNWHAEPIDEPVDICQGMT